MTAPLSFCETATAGPRTPWHIRRLGPDGRKPGGIHPPATSLCGRVVAWDLPRMVTPETIRGGPWVCPRCAAEALASLPRDT